MPITSSLTPDDEAAGKILRLRVEEQHGQDFVVDQALDERAGTRQHLVQVEGGVNLLADLGEGGQGMLGNIGAFGFDGIHK